MDPAFEKQLEAESKKCSSDRQIQVSVTSCYTVLSAGATRDMSGETETEKL